jgi:hypothetical protein
MRQALLNPTLVIVRNLESMKGGLFVNYTTRSIEHDRYLGPSRCPTLPCPLGDGTRGRDP